MSYFIKNTTNDVSFDLDNILPNGNLAITNLYGGFPNVTFSPVNNNSHDTRIGTTGYSTITGDLGEIIPGKGTFYGPEFMKNQVVCEFGDSNQSPANAKFNNTYSYYVEIEDCYNHISLIVQGGGGGGGGSNNGSNSNGRTGGAGGGGGWRSQKRIPIVNSGRKFTVQVGSEGTCGFSNKYRPGGATNGGSGDITRIKSNNNNQFIEANGGNGGVSRDLANSVLGGNVGNSSNNLSGGNVLSGNADNNNNGQNGGEGPDAGGTLGGDSIYNNTADPARLFTSVKSPNHNGNNVALTNNRPGIPGGGTSNNVNYSGTPGTTIIHIM
jgi:hypothetical protein